MGTLDFIKKRTVDGLTCTYNVAISLYPVMCFFPIEKFNVCHNRREKAERSGAFTRPR